MLEVHVAVVNHPEFIETQHRLLSKYMSGDWNMVVFNDCKQWPDFSNFGNAATYQDIRRVCERLNILCVDVPNEHHRTQKCAVVRCADSMRFMQNLYRVAYDGGMRSRVLCMDSDMFPVAPMNADTLYADFAAAVVPQYRGDVSYVWNGLCYFDFSKIWDVHAMDWSDGHFKGQHCDVGGGMTHWLDRRPPDAPLYEIQHRWSLNWGAEDELPEAVSPKWRGMLDNDVKNVNGKYWCELYDDKFLHYRAGGNWELLPRSVDDSRTNLFLQTVNDVLLAA